MHLRRAAHCARLFPAYAGVIPKEVDFMLYSEAFPRLRGGDPSQLSILGLSKGFSPPTRG